MKLRTRVSLFISFFILVSFIQNKVLAADNVVENHTIRVYAPNATTVHVSGGSNTWGLPGVEADLSPIGDSLWEVEIGPVNTGFHTYTLYVNGVSSLNPLDKPYWAGSIPASGIEVPAPDSAFYSMKDVPHGIVRIHFYPYKTSKTTTIRRCAIYLPPGYNRADNKTYPVLYLQHGNGEYELSWSQQGQVANIIDNLIATGEAEPMIVVMENGMTQNYTWLFQHGFQAEIESKYRVNTDKKFRAVAGLSMGGGQACDLAVNAQSLFSYLGIFSSSLDLTNPILFQNTNDNFELFWMGWGDQDEALVAASHMDTQLSFYRINHVATVYQGGHEWQVWRKCLRDFAPLLFKPYTYTNPFSDIKVEESNMISVYPNPFSETIRISFHTEIKDQSIEIVVSDLSGRVIYSGKCIAAQAEELLNNKLVNMSDGVYNLTINAEQTTYNSKIVKTY